MGWSLRGTWLVEELYLYSYIVIEKKKKCTPKGFYAESMLGVFACSLSNDRGNHLFLAVTL